MEIRRFIMVVCIIMFLLTGCCDERTHKDLQVKYDKLQEKYENLQKEYESYIKPNPEDISVCLLDARDEMVDLVATKTFKSSVKKQTEYFLSNISDNIVLSIKSNEEIKKIVIMDSDGSTWEEETEKIDENTYIVNVKVMLYDLYTVIIKNKKNTIYCSFKAY